MAINYKTQTPKNTKFHENVTNINLFLRAKPKLETQNYEGKTNKEVLLLIAESNAISEIDEKILRYWAYKLGFNNAVITCGVVYPFGSGRPISGNSFAKVILQGLGFIPYKEVA